MCEWMALEEQTPSEVEVALDEEQQQSHPVVIESNTMKKLRNLSSLVVKTF